jgi:hypothetical protein
MSCEPLRQLENSIREILFRPYQTKQLNDIILKDIDSILIEHSYKLKILQMRVGQIWELAACHYGWIKTNGTDLINTKTKQALELKNSDITDNSSSRHRNFEKLKEFKNNNPDYEIFYACINCSPNKKSLSHCNGIICVSGDKCLDLLFGDKANDIVNLVRKLVNEFLNKNDS